MINKLKTYWILGSTLVIAILILLFQRRGQKIRDLQREQVTTKLDEKLKDLKDNVDQGEKDYAKALQHYRNLRDAYNKLNPES